MKKKLKELSPGRRVVRLHAQRYPGMKKPTTGRPALFRGKMKTSRVAGIMTPTGKREFERLRKHVAYVATRYRVDGKEWSTTEISDGDVIEYLARGPEKVEQQWVQAALDRGVNP